MGSLADSFKDEFKGVVTSTVPIIIIILALQLFVVKGPTSDILMFLVCTIFLLLGFTLFLVGVNVGIKPVGNSIGNEIPRRKSKLFMIGVVFTISFLATVAEPDVAVFCELVTSIYTTLNSQTLVYAIAVGVGVFLIIAAAKIVYNLPLKFLLLAGYIIVIALTFMVPEGFLGIAFDSGGVTTGPMTVPILLSLGVGICSVASTKNELDGFGMVGLASIGPIIALLIFGIFVDSSTISDVGGSTVEYHSDLGYMLEKLADVIKSVAISMIPLCVFFAFFQRVFLMYTWQAVKNMLIGIGLASLGVVMFLTSVYSGYMPIATNVGLAISGSHPIWVVLLGFVLGFLVVIAEPAVTILCDQIEESSKGEISRKTILLTLSIGVASFVAIGMVKLVYDIPFIYIIVPAIAIAIVLMLLSDNDMVGIAFDAGGVATGPMAVTIIMSMYTGIGAAMYDGLEEVINGFGIVAMIATAPLVFLSLLGVIFKMKKKRSALDE